MNDQVEILNIDDFDAVMAFFAKRDTYFGEALQSSSMERNLRTNLVRTDMWRFVGVRNEDGSLRSVLGARDAQDSPTWLMSWGGVEINQHGAPLFQKSGYLHLIDNQVRAAEERNRFCFFAALPEEQAAPRLKRVLGLIGAEPWHILNTYQHTIWWRGKVNEQTPTAVKYMLWNASDLDKDFCIVQFSKRVSPDNPLVHMTMDEVKQ